MKFLLKPIDPAKLASDVLVAFCWEKDLSSLRQLDEKLSGLITEAIKKEGFAGKENEYLILSTKGDIGSYKILVAGLGERENFDIFSLIKAIAFTLKKAKEAKPAKIGLIIDDYWIKKLTAQQTVQTIVETVILSNYRFLKYKSQKDQLREIEEVDLIIHPSKIALVEEAIKIGQIYASATNLARDLVNEPGAVTTPSYLADIACNISKDSSNKIKVRILNKDKIEKLGMGAYLGVAKGADEAPKFIHLAYKSAGSRKKVVIIGKGITFDTGGLSLKSSEHMETMKQDMAGAAVVLAVFNALPQLRIAADVVGLIPACENMPSASAIKPGDILHAANGKTIEVINTDAEGRLTLADAISYANAFEKPDYIIDVATLTGACRSALGEDIAGLWGNSEELLEKIKKAGSVSGEKLWQMPLEKDYRELVKSDIADIRNTSTGKYGGAITAALFLADFVGDSPWIHLDIAGPAYMEKETALTPKGGSGFGVRLLLQFLKEL